MSPLFEFLISYIRDGSDADKSKEFAQQLNCHDALSLRTISINILRWAKLEHQRTLWMQQGRPTKHKPMKLSRIQYPWEVYLCELVSTNYEFHRLFKICGNDFLFADNVSLEERAELCEFAYQMFNPQKIV